MQNRFSILGGDVDHLAFADSALWVASTPSGELRKIDPRTNEVVFTRTLQAELCCVAAGGGYVWAASNPDGVVWKVTTNGTRAADDQAPVAHPDASHTRMGRSGPRSATKERSYGSTRPPTRFAQYDLGHSVTSVDVRDGLLAAGVRHSVEDIDRRSLG